MTVFSHHRRQRVFRDWQKIDFAPSWWLRMSTLGTYFTHHELVDQLLENVVFVWPLICLNCWRLWALGIWIHNLKLSTKFLLPSIFLWQQLCFDDEHPLQNLLLSNWVRIVVWTWRWHLFSWWPSHHVWILVWIIGSFYLISQPCTYFFVALLYCSCTLFYIAHTFFHLLLSHSISNRIANMHCTMHSMAKSFL